MNADRNLLFGILAFQNNFIDRPALLAAFDLWTADKTRPLGDVFVEMGKLDADQRRLLDALAIQHIKLHGGDTEQSLAAVSSLGSVRKDLEQIADFDVQASLAGAATIRPDQFSRADHEATRARSAGTSSSSGQRFTILRLHAKGGLGQVSVARDEELNREVAFKEIQDRYADDPASRSRFMLEAEVTGGLEHPGIVPVYGLGHYGDGRPFYAMRFVQGDSLHDAIKQFHDASHSRTAPAARDLKLRKLLARFIDVCNAIEYAHSRGILHRDLKPGNVMLGKYGETLVVDWGLAKPLGHRDSHAASGERTLHPASASASGSAQTQMGSAIGTPQYMSPEQAEGRLDELGPSTDVYSLGATLYCLLTGRAPFADADVWVMVEQVAKGDFPPLRSVKKGVPPALEAICVKAMALKPADRYASARALAADIERWLSDIPVAAYTEPWIERLAQWGRQYTTAAVIVAVLLGATTVIVPVASLAWTFGKLAAPATFTYMTSNEFDGNGHAQAVVGQMTAVLSRAQTASTFYERGRAYLSLGKTSEAIHDFSEAIKLDREFAEAYYARGLAATRSGSTQEALADLAEAIRIAPQHVEARFEHSVASYQAGAYEQTIADCTDLLNLRPASARAYGLRSRAYAATGDLFAASADLTMAKALDPNFEP
jgi:serine/threonine-protein kinase